MIEFESLRIGYFERVERIMVVSLRVYWEKICRSDDSITGKDFFGENIEE